jgi:S-methylmethionine-dependent homocysteine/selenocysteine methylase
LTCQSIIQEAAELHITLKAIGINCSTPSAITESVPILVKLVEGMDIKVIAYGNCFKTTTSEWITGLKKNENAVTDGNACTSETRRAEIMDYNTCVNDDDYDDKGILTVDAYSRYACEWARLGARIIGGCCGCSPMHMQQVAIALKDF